MSQRWVLPGLLALLACFTGGWFLQRRLGVSEDVYQQARLFEQVLAHVRDYHVDSLPEDELYRRAIDGMLGQLHDPYAALLVGKDYQRQQERTTGDYAGIGLQVDARNGWITVVAPLDNLARRPYAIRMIDTRGIDEPLADRPDLRSDCAGDVYRRHGPQQRHYARHPDAADGRAGRGSHLRHAG